MREASKALDRSKHFVKWSLSVRRQCKNLYVRNLALNARLRSMNKSLDKAWRLVKKYKEATKIPPYERVSRLGAKALSEAKPTQPMLTEHKDPTPKVPKVQASTSKSFSKRKRR